MDHDEIEYISPDARLVQELMRCVLDGEQGAVGLKVLPFVDYPGITYNYRVRFEDGTGEVIREEILPVFVDAGRSDPKERLGQRVIEGDSIKGSPDEKSVRVLLENEGEMRSSAERYISQRVESHRDELQKRRHEETRQELEDLEAYAESERERIEAFIADYERKAQAGTDMDIAIRGQRDRLSKLEDRIKQRRQELQRKAQIISLAPEIANLCLTLSI
jgi:putative cell wall-binding protein